MCTLPPPCPVLAVFIICLWKKNETLHGLKVIWFLSVPDVAVVTVVHVYLWMYLSCGDEKSHRNSMQKKKLVKVCFHLMHLIGKGKEDYNWFLVFGVLCLGGGETGIIFSSLHLS